MRKGVIALVAVAMLATTVSAQTVFLGPTLLFKGGVNGGNIPEGQKTEMNINLMPDISANLLWLFNKNSNIGLVADVAYSTVSFRMRPESESFANDDNTVVYKASHLTIAPSIYFSGFMLGFGFGFPMATNVATVSGIELPASTDDLNSPLIDIRLGGMIPVWEHESGRLSILIHGAYTLNGLVKMDEGADDTYNPKVISGGLGVAYHFNLTSMTR